MRNVDFLKTLETTEPNGTPHFMPPVKKKKKKSFFFFYDLIFFYFRKGWLLEKGMITPQMFGLLEYF